MKNNKNTLQNNLFTAQPIIKTYGSSASWVFGYVAYFVAKRGTYDTSVSWPELVRRYTGVGQNTYKDYLKQFVADGLLIQDDKKYTFNKDNVAFDEVFTAYINAFGGGVKLPTDVSLIEVNPKKCDVKNMVGAKAKHERSVITLEAFLRDRVAGNLVFKKELEVTFKSYAYLADLFGLNWRTIKKILLTITAVKRSFHIIRCKVSNALSLSKTKKTDKLYDKKVQKFKESLKLKTQSMFQRMKEKHQPAPA